MIKNIVIFYLLLFLNIYSNEIETKFIQYGLIDLSLIDPSIKVDLVNSSSKKNYFRKDFYHGLQKAYVHRDVAIKLSNAQKYLKKANPNYSLLIMDAARPNSVSWEMYNKMKSTKFKKYVADPTKGSLHNYGVAVDITIFDNKNKKMLDMGSIPFYKNRIELFFMLVKMKLSSNKISTNQANNRNILKTAMLQAGFKPLSFEWWHFESFSKEETRLKYKMIE